MNIAVTSELSEGVEFFNTIDEKMNQVDEKYEELYMQNKGK